MSRGSVAPVLLYLVPSTFSRLSMCPVIYNRKENFVLGLFLIVDVSLICKWYSMWQRNRGTFIIKTWCITWTSLASNLETGMNPSSKEFNTEACRMWRGLELFQKILALCSLYIAWIEQVNALSRRQDGFGCPKTSGPLTLILQSWECSIYTT